MWSAWLSVLTDSFHLIFNLPEKQEEEKKVDEIGPSARPGRVT